MEVLRPESINNTSVGYVPNPDGRGTISLLFSCLLTLSLCVWSAMHLDLPPYGETDIEYTCRYLKWSVLGIFGPELVIWAAWRQFISARTLTNFIKKSSNERELGSQQWTMVHGFYAGMGGFVFDMTTPDMSRGPIFIPQRRLHVTPRGIQLLAKCGLLPDISMADITDKSKTDGSGKLICCLQVSWMLVQAALRVAVGLPVTPLETNTIGHVICALINYALWWYKPRWIKEPTILNGEWTRAMCAFMYMSSQVSAENKVNRDVLRDFGVRTEMSGLVYVPNDSSTQEDLNVQKLCGGVASRSASQEEFVEDIRLTPELEPSNNVFPTKGRIVFSNGIEPAAQTLHQKEAISETDSSAMRDIRWRLACEAIERYPAIRERLDVPPCDQAELRYREARRLYPEMPDKVSQHPRGYQTSEHVKTHSSKLWWCMSEELVVERPRNWPGDDLVRHMQGHLMGIILWSSSTVYGAIHVAGWNEQFPTIVESWFWRMSGVYIVFSGLLWSFFNLLGHLSGSVWWFWYDILEGTERKRSHILIYVLCCIGGSLYVIARVYLVLEAFVSLRSLPASAYDSPSWILTVPHL